MSALRREPKAVDLNENKVNKSKHARLHVMTCSDTRALSMSNLSATGSRPNKRESTIQ